MQTSVNPQLATREQFYFPLLIVLMALLSYVRILFFNNVVWDDTNWLQAVFTSNNLAEFLNTGFVEMRRVPQGICLYLIFMLFKISDHAYIILHLIAIAAQIITPVFLYFLIYELFKNRLSAFIIGSILIIYPIDTTIPIYTLMLYKLGLMFSVVSFYLTSRALFDKLKWFYMTIALLLSGISYYLLVEGSIALEPARLFIIGFIFHNKGYKKKDVIKYSIMYWLPFVLLCIPIVIYKLLYKPYGTYAGEYPSDWSFGVSSTYLTDWSLILIGRSQLLSYLAMLLGKNWALFLCRTAYYSLWSMISGLVAFITTYALLEKAYVYVDETGFHEIGHPFINPNPKSGTTRITVIICLGVLMLVPTVIVYLFASRKLEVGFDSRQGCIMQFGHALIIGGLICGVFNKLFVDPKYKKKFITLSMAILFGLGVFFNNVNLDLYFDHWNQVNQFYQAFIERFPTVPKKADFMIDVQMGTYGKEDHPSSSFEVAINMFYAESNKPEHFRGHKVTGWSLLNTYKKVGPTQYETLPSFGKAIYDTRDIIVIRWRPGEFLVNREIVEKYPQIDYKDLADKEIPPILPAPTYPLREKANSFWGKKNKLN